MKLSLSEQLAYSTVRIISYGNLGQVSTGTGYIVNIKEDKEKGTRVPIIITNKHVIYQAMQGDIVFTTADNEGNPMDTNHYIIHIQDFAACWMFHPDQNVDLCAMLLAPIIENAERNGKRLFYRAFSQSFIPNVDQLAQLTALEDIIMIGYPDGLWDEVNNKPIFRKGITATHPNFDYNGKKEFMIDAACFPGSSGSPVLLLNEGSYTDKNGDIHVGESRIFLLGTLYCGPQHLISGDVRIVDVPMAQRSVALATMPNNLGLVIKSMRISELAQLF